MNQTLCVNRADFSDLSIVNLDQATLKDGYIRVEIGPWALTANNITYMVTGDMIGYWKFFDPQAYGITPDEAGDWGRMPVWGYGKVTQSNCADVKIGAQIYGFFPVAKTIDIKPVKISAMGFHDGADHRVALHPIYNNYTLIDADPSFAAHKDLQPVLRPLFTTSFLIDDFLADEKFFGAEQVLLLSASSKTAMGTGFCLKQRGNIQVAGLTSAGNMSFTKGTGFYDRVQSYDAITDLNPDIKTVIVDMAGNGEVLSRIYDHFEENIVYNCMVGKSHWQGSAPPKPKPKPKLGAAPVMFFAPDRAQLRIGEWGGAGFAKNLAARWLPFCDSAKDWLTLEHKDDIGDYLKTYADFLGGKASPAKGYLFKL